MQNLYISLEIWELLKSVPCHTEFFKYVTWHNHVVEMSWNGNYPTMTIYFEDYNNHSEKPEDANFEESEKAVAMNLTKFLEYDVDVSEDQEELPSFLKVNMYKHYFTEEEQASVKRFVEAMALRETMALLERYF